MIRTDKAAGQGHVGTPHLTPSLPLVRVGMCHAHLHPVTLRSVTVTRAALSTFTWRCLMVMVKVCLMMLSLSIIILALGVYKHVQNIDQRLTTLEQQAG